MRNLDNKKKVKVLEIAHGLAPGGIESFLINVFENIDRNKIEINFALACEGKQFYEDIELDINYEKGLSSHVSNRG